MQSVTIIILASRLPAPLGKSFNKWMFFLRNAINKSTVICVHPRFFVTFRHGPHLKLKIGDDLIIFQALQESEDQIGINVSVVQIDDILDFVLLKSPLQVVEVKYFFAIVIGIKIF